MERVMVWDPLVRLFHWSLVLAFGANALVIDDDSTLHEWVGYLVMGLVLLRILWGFIGPGYVHSLGRDVGRDHSHLTAYGIHALLVFA